MITCLVISLVISFIYTAAGYQYMHVHVLSDTWAVHMCHMSMYKDYYTKEMCSLLETSIYSKM